MNKKQLNLIDERVRKRSTGKWLTNERGHLIVPVSNRLSRHVHFGDTGQAAADIDFILNAADDIIALRKDIDRQDKELIRLKNELNASKQLVSNCKEKTLTEAIRLVKTIFLATPSAKDAMTEVVKLLKEFKIHAYEEYVVNLPKLRKVF